MLRATGWFEKRKSEGMMFWAVFAGFYKMTIDRFLPASASCVVGWSNRSFG